MRLRSLVLFGSLAALVIATPIACSSTGDRPPPSEYGEGGAGYEGGSSDGAGSADSPEAGTPASIAHVSTICGTTACGIMGLRKSGFQELADVSFVVKDADGKPVSGVPVTFELESPPTGTDFLSGTTSAPTVVITTDAMGVASARVESGVTLGVFTVIATVSPTIQAKSPAIGVRGVTPANRGFKLQCDLKNLAAAADALPPKPLKTNCTATLIDRFNNPVGKGTTINLKVEAGAIASSVQSTAFNATGANPDEGKATVEFNTVGTYPAVDVDKLPGEAFSGTANQRDGLVTILAYVAGEEAFDDNNSNGQWDPGENFIDQGEPFVDANDNNQWDNGEIYADVAPSNGKYDPPNGVWDKQTTIWTTTYILYSGIMTKYFASEDPINVPADGQAKPVTVAFADNLFNPPQSGAVTTFNQTRIGNRGTVNSVFDTILDGYGFTLTRALYDAANPSMGCSASVARCVWMTNFAFPSSPYTRGVTATITGAAAGTPGGPVNDTLKFTATVHGTKSEFPIAATFQ
jgi:adhesin/invasin